MDGDIRRLAPEAVPAALGSGADGLDAQQVQALLEELGPNSLEAPRGAWWLRSLLRQLTNFFSLLLDVAGVICFVAERVQPGEGMALLGAALLGVSLLNALFSFAQEYRAERAMEALRALLPRRVNVRRGGRGQEVPAEALVPGDLVVLREGDRVPADARVIECEALLVNNAPLTGESAAVAIEAGAVDADDTQRENLVHAGCTVLRGTALAVVHATGLRTRFGQVAALSHGIQRKPSPLERETAHMVRVLTAIATVMGVAFFAYGVHTGRPLWVNLVFMMGIIVANVPEGLLPTFTLSLAMGSTRMARRNVLVKSLNAVEALGAVHAVCTDKTGTLTRNELAVGAVCDATGTALEGDAATDLLRAALHAAELTSSGEGWSGDPLDVAIAEHARAAGLDVDAVLASSVRCFPFDTEKRRAGGLAATDTGPVFAVKGAYESLVPLLQGTGALDQARVETTVQTLADTGMRVIAVALREVDPAQAEGSGGGAPGEPGPTMALLERGVRLLGFLCLEDPLRAEVPDAVRRCQEAGIRVLMITGDHPHTAWAVARSAGLVAPGAAREVVTGEQLAQMREQALVELLRGGACVFARTSPEQKMKIVSALHELDLIVAVTGDGVNDAPALKAADVGIAMGRGGTDVARESAQVILLDDNFASIVAGIEEGRTIFANIHRFTNYVLVSNGPEIIPYLLYILFPVPLALTVIQILCIDLGTDIVPSMALGQERPRPEAMRAPPRERHASLLTPAVLWHSYGFLGLLEASFALGLFFWVLGDGGWQWGTPLAADDPLYRSATGITLATIMLMQIGNLVGRRARFASGLDVGLLRNRLMVAGILMQVLFSWAVLYAEPVARVLGTGPVDIEVYATAWLGIPLIFGLDYLRKRVARRIWPRED